MHHHFSYTPPGPVAREFVRCDSFVSAIMGPIGSGKSTASVARLTANAFRQPVGVSGRRLRRTAIVRNSFPELKTTTIKTWHQWWPQHIGKWRESGPPQHIIDLDDILWEVIFIALDRQEDVRKLLSMELSDAWINEAREVPKAVVDGITGRVGRYPPVRDGGCPSAQVLLDTNAPDTDHWWYKLAEENTPEEWSFFRQPPAVLGPDEGLTVNPNAENVENLPERYYERAAQGKGTDWIKVYLRGDYGFVQDGRPVYPEYRDGLHCRQFELSRHFGLAIGLDFGLTPAAVIGQRSPAGRVYWRHELVSEHMGAVRFGQELRTFLKGPLGEFDVEHITGDPSGAAEAQTDERTIFQVLEVAGIKALPAHSNDFTLRREAVAAPLSRIVDGEPGLLIHPDCRQVRKGMAGGYRFRRVAVRGTERYADAPEKNLFSHPCFVAGTSISTPFGPRPVERLRVGQYVSTPTGRCRIGATMARDVDSLIELELSDGSRLRCTPDHPFAVRRGGFLPAEALEYADLLVREGEPWEDPRYTLSSTSAAGPTTGSRRATIVAMLRLAGRTCTETCGRLRTGLSRRAGTSTTRTATRATTTWATSKPGAGPSTAVFTASSSPWLVSAPSSHSPVPSLPRPIGAWPGLPPPPTVPEGVCSADRWSRKRVSSAVRSIASGAAHAAAASVPPTVNRLLAGLAAWMMSSGSASGAAGTSPATSTTVPERALRVVASRRLGAGRVFNLQVDVAHCYYAGGVLVSNCEAGQYLMLGSGEGRSLVRPKSRGDRQRFAITVASELD
jgi:hypothetical protein